MVRLGLALNPSGRTLTALGAEEFQVIALCEGANIEPLSLSSFTMVYLRHPVVGLHGVDPLAQPCRRLRRFLGGLRSESRICHVLFADLRHSLGGDVVLVVPIGCRLRKGRQLAISMQGVQISVDYELYKAILDGFRSLYVWFSPQQALFRHGLSGRS